jgi:hypothetical protein
MSNSHSQPAGLIRPSTSNGPSRKNKLGKLRKTPKTRPKTASANQSSSLQRLSPSRSRPSKHHEDRAKSMSYQRLRELLSDSLFQEAIKRKGCIDTQLHPRRMESFRRQPNRAALLSKRVAQLNFEAYEIRRIELLAMVLQEFEVVKEEMKQEEAKVKHEQEKLAKVFVKQIGGEEGRTKKIVQNRHKIQNVSLAENRLLIARRNKFQKQANKAQNAQEKYLSKLKRDREEREKRGKRQQEKIAQVSNMKDQLLKKRNQMMEDRFRQRDARIAHKMVK